MKKVVTTNQISEDEVRQIILRGVKNHKRSKSMYNQNRLYELSKLPLYDLYYRLIGDNLITLNDVIKQYRTLDMCKLAVKRKFSAIRYIPKQFKTQELFNQIIKEISYNDKLLKLIPDEFRTYELCKTVLSNHSGLLSDVPIQHRTEQMCILAVEFRCLYDTLKSIPTHVLNSKIMHTLIKKKPSEYSWIIKDEKFSKFDTIQLFEQYISNSKNTNVYIPEKYKTKQMYSKILQKAPLMIHNLPMEYKTEQMYCIAVRSNPFTIYRIPNKALTYQIVKTAIIERPDVILNKYYYSVYVHFLDENIYKTICNNDIKKLGLCVDAFKYIPSKYITYETYLNLIRYNPDIISIVPLDVKTQQMCNIAIKMRPWLIVHVPKQFIDIQMIQNVFSKPITQKQTLSKILIHIPHDLLNIDIFIKIIQYNIKLMSAIPKKFRTQQLYKVAASLDVKYLNKVI